MEISEYKKGDVVQVLVNNPRNENLMEWRDAEVLDKRMIYPRVGETHKPYPILIVRLTRTYCKVSNTTYRFVDNIPVFVSNDLTFFDKENDEGIIYPNEIRLKAKPIQEDYV